MALRESQVATVLLRQLLSMAHMGPSPETGVLLLPASELEIMASSWPSVRLFRAQQSGSLPVHPHGAVLAEQSV